MRKKPAKEKEYLEPGKTDKNPESGNTTNRELKNAGKRGGKIRSSAAERKSHEPTDDTKRVLKAEASSKNVTEKEESNVFTDEAEENDAIRETKSERDARREIREIPGDKKLGTVRIKQILNDVDEVTREDQRKKISNGSAYVDITISNLTTKALLDTGAQVSAITKELFDKMIDARVEMRVIPIRKFSLIGALSEKRQTASNRVQFKFNIDDHEFIAEFIVIKSLAYNVILRLDFMKNNNISIDCEPNNVFVRFREDKRISAEIERTLSIDDAERCVKTTTRYCSTTE